MRSRIFIPLLALALVFGLTSSVSAETANQPTTPHTATAPVATPEPTGAPELPLWLAGGLAVADYDSAPTCQWRCPGTPSPYWTGSANATSEINCRNKCRTACQTPDCWLL